MIAPVTSTSIHPTPIDPTSINPTSINPTSIDPNSIIQSESPTAVILAIAVLLSVLSNGMTGLVRVVMGQRRSGR